MSADALVLDLAFMLRLVGWGDVDDDRPAVAIAGPADAVVVDLSHGRASAASTETPALLAGLADLPGVAGISLAHNDLLDEHVPLIGASFVCVARWHVFLCAADWLCGCGCERAIE